MLKRIITLPLPEILPYPGNAKIHGQAQIEELAGAIREIGYINRIVVDEEGVILAGHGRRLALLHLGWQEAEVEMLEGLSEAQKRQIRLFDNRIAEKGEIDQAVLLDELLALSDLGAMDLSGYGMEDLDALLEQYTQPPDDMAALVLEDGSAKRGESPEVDGGPAQTKGITYRQKFSVLIECPDEAEQEKTFNALQGQGYQCKILVN